MSDDTPEDAIERGLEAYFAGDTITDLLEGIDVDALAEGEALDDAVEYEQLGKALGALIGRTAAKGVSNSGLLGRFVKESLGSEVGGRVGEVAAAALVEQGTPEALAEQLQGLANVDQPTEAVDETTARPGAEEFGAIGDDWTEIDIEDATNERE